MPKKERELAEEALEQAAGGLSCLPDVLHCGQLHGGPRLPKGIAGWSVEPLPDPGVGGVIE